MPFNFQDSFLSIPIALKSHTARCAFGIALVLSTALPAWLSKKSKNKGTRETTQPPSLEPKVIKTKIAAPSRFKTEIRPTKITDITHAQMMAHIMRVPPAQRDSIEKHYIGLRVRWLVSLDSVSRIGENDVMIHARLVSGRTVVECNGLPSDVECLLHVPEGGEFYVEGTLHLIGSGLCIINDGAADIPQKAETH